MNILCGTGLKILAVPLGLLLVSACSGISPQAEHTFARLPDAQELATRTDRPGDLATQRLNNRLSQRDLVETLDFTLADAGVKAPLAGFGFFPGRSDGYAVYRDGSAFYIDAQGALVPLDKLAPRVDQVILAGPERRHVVGLHPSGTHSSWNTSNFTQQLVLAPQQTTFSQRQVLDVEPVSGEYIASAAEGGLLEVWSLRSGNRVRAHRSLESQPRSIASGSGSGAIVFGSDDGAVKIWDDTGAVRWLYSHSGPVLEIKLLPKRGLIVSASKDGTVKVYDRQRGVLVQQMTFPRAVYDLHVSPDQRYVIAAPATGPAQVLYLSNMRIRELWGYAYRQIGRVEYASTSQAVALADGNLMRRWHLRRGTSLSPFTAKNDAEVSDFTVAARQNLLIMASEDNQIEFYKLLENRNIGAAVVSETDITAVRASENGNWLLIHLVDGQIARMRIDPTQSLALEIE